MIANPSFDVLRNLPGVFHVADLTVRLGWKPRLAQKRLYLWSCCGVISAMDRHSGVYANLIGSRYPDWEIGLRMVMPSAVVSGLEVLRRAGWITQIPYLITVTVSAAQRVHKVDRFTVNVQAPEWFDAAETGIRSGEGVALPSLAPAWALADLVKQEGWCECGIGPDDIYWVADECDWENACAAFHLGKLSMNPSSAPNV